ncbi:MAG: hypothetical protein ACO331_15600 [Prochlorothrix sp.]
MKLSPLSRPAVPLLLGSLSIALTSLLTTLSPAQAVPVTTCTETGLRSAITQTPDGGTVTFNFPAGTVINLGSELNLSKALTFDGTGVTGLTLSGQDRTRILRSTKNLTLKNLTLTRGKVATRNTSLSCEGGAVLVTFGTLTVNNVTFTANSGVRGGAICGNYQGRVNITNSRFLNNQSQQGGAIFTNATDLTVSGSTFQGNRSRANSSFLGIGGAIYTFRSLTPTQPIRIENSRFAGNSAQHEGGAVFVSLANGLGFVLQNSTLVNNEALINTSSGVGSGGALRLSHTGGTSTAQINNVVFANNAADQEGGAAWLGGVGATLNVNLTKVTFYGNNSGRVPDPVLNETGGGAVLLANGPNSTTQMNQVTFALNNANNHETSGAIYPAGITLSRVILQNTIFDRNCSRKDLPGTPTVENCTHLVHALTPQPFSDGPSLNNYAWIANVNAATKVAFPLTRRTLIQTVGVRAYVDNGDAAPDHPCSAVASGAGGKCL